MGASYCRHRGDRTADADRTATAQRTLADNEESPHGTATTTALHGTATTTALHGTATTTAPRSYREPHTSPASRPHARPRPSRGGRGHEGRAARAESEDEPSG